MLATRKEKSSASQPLRPPCRLFSLSHTGDFFTHPELGNDIGLMGALLPFVLRVVAGACVGRWTGQPRMPPRERQHEGL